MFARTNAALKNQTLASLHLADLEPSAQSPGPVTPSAGASLDSYLTLIPSQDANLSVSLILTVARAMFARTKDVLRSQTLAIPLLVVQEPYVQ